MKKHLFVVLAVLMAFSLPFLATGCGGADSDTTDTTAGPVDSGDTEMTAPEPASSMTEPTVAVEPDQTPDSEAPTEGTEEMSADAPADAAVDATADQAAGAAVTGESIVGTKWSAGGMSFTFEKDGVLKVNDSLPGTWSIEGTTLKVGAMGQDYSATIEGDKIIYDGTPLERAN